MLKNLVSAVKNWWIILIIGILCVACGIAVFCTPTAGATTLAIILMICLIVGGILGVIFVISNKDYIPAWGWDLILPILTIIAGIVLACNPAASIVLIVVVFSVGTLFKGIETIASAIAFSKVEGSGWGWTLFAGIITVLLAIFLMVYPLVTGLVINFLVGFALLFMGIGAIVTSIQLSKIKGQAKQVQKAYEDAVNGK